MAFPVVPALPEVFPHVPAHPAFPCEDRPPALAGLEEVPPATNVSLPVLDALFQGHAHLRVPSSSDVVLQFVQTRLRCGYPPVGSDAKPRKLAVPRPPDTAFGHIDSQLQVFTDSFRDFGQHPISAPLAAHEGRDIVGVAAVAQSLALNEEKIRGSGKM